MQADNLSFPNEALRQELKPSKVRVFDGHDWFITKTTRRNLPHWELRGSSYFITTCVVEEAGKPFINPILSQMIVNKLKEFHKELYILECFVVMPDHLHIIIKPINGTSLASIMRLLKGGTSVAINRSLGRRGQFWQKENFDHLIRDFNGMEDKWEYIRQNPVKAKLVKNPEDYPYSSFYIPKK